MPQVNPSIFKAYDIRAIYPSDINEENIVQIVQAIYKLFSKDDETKQRTVVLGHDMRLSSPQLFEAAKKALVEAGAHVIDIGLVSTPTFYYAVFHFGYDAGIQITASHNPKDYNGMKFVKNSPKGLIKIGKMTGMDDIKQMAMDGVTFPENHPEGQVTIKHDVLEDEVSDAIKLLDYPDIKKFKIVADTANAMGAQYIGALFQKIPADLLTMNFHLDGSFPSHQPDPLDFDNLVDLQKRVVEEKADFGLAPDGDGDRLFFIDEQGHVVHASIVTGLIAREFLKKDPNAKILFDIRYIFTPQKLIEESGGRYEISKVGHAYITEKLAETDAVFAGESSAHYFYKATGNAESQILTILTVLKVLSETGKPLSVIAEELRRSHESGEINFKVKDTAAVIAKLKEDYQDGEFSDLDGISVKYSTWRFNVRTSNTEPLLRLNVEANTHPEMVEKRDTLVRLIKSFTE